MNVWLNDTVSPVTGISTSRTIRTRRPSSSTASTDLSGVQSSHARAKGLRVSKANRPPSARTERIVAGAVRSSSSLT
ncbi:hypothetical protein [Streptomyces sp. NPDC057580]|uniref:hypothetical protein n=1 Tax=Streptomyces sp. NPDC057580 TaxID=3346173 RepID=UPI003697C514